jgi:5-formyltetrahydrofolate cyclo-ligase
MLLDKKALRKEMLNKRFALSKEAFVSYNEAIYEALTSLDIFKQAQTIGVYVSYKHEVDTRRLIENYAKEKRICVPKIEKGKMNFYAISSLDALKPGFFGVDEPESINLIEPSEIDLMLVPLLAFDHNDFRIGYGKGFYDAYMKEANYYKLGLAYSFQEIADTQPHPLDVALDTILTEEGFK